MNISISNAIQSSAISGGGEPSALPLALDLSITGGFAIGDVQTGNYTYFDPNGVAESGTTFKWYRVDGSTRTEVGTAQSYTLVAADEQKAIEFEVTPRNADTLVGPTASVQKNIPLFPVPPTATNVSFTGTLEVGQEMQGSYDYGDINGDPESGTTFKWWRADNAAGTLNRTEISGATSINYTLVSPADEGKYIQFQVTPRNDIGEVGSMSPSSWRGAVDSLPVASNVTYTGNNNVGELLSSSFDYSDANSDPEGTSLYQWLTSATSGGAGTPISGATSANYTVAATDEGNFLSVRVTPVTSSGVQGLRVSSGARAAAVGPLPGFSTNPSFTGILKKGDVLTGTYVYNSASATQGTSTFKWYNSVSGAISGATSLTYTLQASDIGDNISFGVTPVSDTGVQGTEFITPTQGPILDSDLVLDNLEMLLDFTESETLGREEVVDGDFPLPNVNWIALAGATIESNGARINNTVTNSFANVKQAISNPNGKTFEFTYDITATDGSTLVVQQLSDIDLDSTTIGTNRKVTFTWDLGIDDLIIKRKSGTTDVTIDNVSLKELTQSIPDSSGNNNVAELFTGKALDFDGDGDYVDISGFSMSGNNATFAFWAYIRDNARADYFFDFQSSTTRFLFGFGQASRKLAVYSGGWEDFGDPPQDQWVRIVLTVNGTTAKCFVDGVQLGTDVTISTYDFSTATIAHIGARYVPETFPKWYDGILSDFQIYNSVWSTDDIAFDYANPNILVTDSTNTGTSIAVTNLKAYWAMSEGAGSLAYDSSGEGNNGTIDSATYDNSQPRIPQLGMQNWSKGSNELLYSSMPSNQVGSGLTWETFASAPSTITVTGGQTAPDGTSTAYLVNGIGAFYQTNIDASIEQTRRSIWAKTVSGTGTVKLMTHNSHTNNTFTITNNWQRFDLVPNSSFAEGVFYAADLRGGTTLTQVIVWGPQVQSNNILNDYRPTDANVVPVTTLIPNPNTPTKDVYANPVRDRDASFNLDGIGYATIADSTSLNISNGTLQFWLKTTDTAFTILSGQSSSEFIGKANVTWFNGNAGTITVYKDDVTSSSNNTPDTDGNWHFYTFTGINVSSWTAFEISNLANFKLDGLLDSVFIYSDVLTSAEIIKNYNFTEPDHQ